MGVAEEEGEESWESGLRDLTLGQTEGGDLTEVGCGVGELKSMQVEGGSAQGRGFSDQLAANG